MAKTNQYYIEKSEEFGAMNYESIPVVLTKGRNIFVWDVEGNRYFDMLSAYSAVNQGHSHPGILKAMQNQSKQLALCSRAFHNDKMPSFLEKICKITRKDKALPMNSGAEGVETAIKCMRKWGYDNKGIEYPKAEIIVAENNFHGRTTTIVGFSSEKSTHYGFGPATPGFIEVPYDDPKALEAAITENTAGFLVEPIQGEAGVKVPSNKYLSAVREICTRNNVLLCCDEIQTGLGRTGKMFASEHWGVEPDIYILGKALSGGFYPISAIATSDEIMSAFTPGSHGSTYGGNPLASAVGIAALDAIVNEKMVERSAKVGEFFLKGLGELYKNREVKDVRGKGLLLAVEMHEPTAKDLCKKLAKEGILCKDTHNTIIRFAPPLTIGKRHIKRVLKKVYKVFDI